MIFTAKQNEFLERAMNGESLYLTGKAGTGKSTVVRELQRRLREEKRKFIAIAPTGIAANNIDGATIHSTFSLNPFEILTYDLCCRLRSSKQDVLKNANTILLDEISMVRADIMDAIHWTFRKNSLSGLPKRQIIVIGDMKQLPPIVDDNMRAVMMGKPHEYRGIEWNFAKILTSLQIGMIDLDEILRQSDPEFISALNEIREGVEKVPYFRQFITKEPNGIILAPHNSTVARYNKEGLDRQEGKEFVYKASVEGAIKPTDFNLENEIRVKDGCKIMYLVNSQNNPLRNGTIGVFVARDKNMFIKVGGVEYPLKKVTLTKKEYVYSQESDSLELEEKGKITQYPFKLAYALSIHKSQGLTFDDITIDLTRNCFQDGQLYTALSRVKTPEGLRIITKHKFKNHE